VIERERGRERERATYTLNDGLFTPKLLLPALFPPIILICGGSKLAAANKL
jgi:hypothetical protein